MSRAVSESQRDIATDSALSLGASLEQSAQDLHDAVGLLGGGSRKSPDAILTSLTNVYSKWRGLAVVDTGSGRLLAARGEAVPLDGLTAAGRGSGGLRPRLVAGRSGAPRLLSFASLDGAAGKSRLVVSSATLRLPSEQDARSTFVTDSGGHIIAAVGKNATHAALRTAVEDGKVDLRRAGRGYLVIGRAAVPDGDRVHGLGLSVATAVPVPAGTAAHGNSLIGPVAAGVLLATGLLVTWLLVRHVQRPLLRLHQEARRLAGGDVERPVSVRGWGEAARIGRSLESLRRRLSGESDASGPAPAPSGRAGLRIVVLCCAALVTAWAVALPLLSFAEGRTQAPAQAAQDQRHRAQAAADRVRRTLDENVADLSAIAQLAGDSRGGISAVLPEQLRRHGAWRSLYLVDAGGHVVTRSGEAPYGIDRAAAARSVKPGAPAVLQLNTSGTTPVSAAVVAVGDGRRKLFAELRPDTFNGVLNRPGLGRSWLVDARGRIIAANEGFIAFSTPPGHGRTTLAADADVSGTPAVAGLHWRIVTHKPLSWTRLAAYETERHAELAGLLAFTAMLLCLGWLELAVLRPLRALDRSAAALASGDRTSVIYPVHHDEVGSVARSLELVRQQLVAAGRRRRDHTSTPERRPQPQSQST
ncbi:HAMP domain-containing protein [Streptomyces sp. NPDC001135]